jgi:hypothetical protein
MDRAFLAASALFIFSNLGMLSMFNSTRRESTGEADA